MARNRDGDGSAARDDLEVVELHFKRHGASSVASAFAVSPDFVDQRLKFDDHGVEVGEVGGERVFGADGFADPVGANLAVVDASRDPIVIASGLAEIGLHEVERLVAHVEAGVRAQSEFILALVAGPMP